MKIEETKDCLTDIYKAGGDSVLLIGSPGIGKSVSIKEAGQQIAQELSREFVDYDDSRANDILANPEKYFLYVDFNLNECEPSDLTGIPREDHQGVRYMPFLWALCLSHTPGILLLDELTNVQRLDVITASYKIVLDRRSGFTKFEDGVMVVAAGNSPEESSAANLLPNPIVDRFIIYNVQRPEVDGWMAWMNRTHPDMWDAKTLAYLKYFPDDFLKLPRETESLDNFPTPRSWTKMALLLEKINARRWDEMVIGSLGQEAGSRFSAFLKIEVPDIEQLLQNPSMFRDLNIEQRYLTSVLVGGFLKNKFSDPAMGNGRRQESEVEKALPLLEVMGDVQRDFVVLSIISCGEQRFHVVANLVRRDKSIGDFLTQVNLLREQVEA